MNKDLIRHKVLKILVDKYHNVVAEFGNPDLSPYDLDKLEIPIDDIVMQLKISYHQFDEASTKAIKDKAYKIVEDRSHSPCCYIADNTFLYYNERVYLKESKNFFQKSPFWEKVILIVISAVIGVAIGMWMDNRRSKAQVLRQDILEQRIDSLINSK